MFTAKSPKNVFQSIDAEKRANRNFELVQSKKNFDMVKNGLSTQRLKESSFYNNKNYADLRIKMGEKRTNMNEHSIDCLLYTSPSPRDATLSRMPSSA